MRSDSPSGVLGLAMRRDGTETAWSLLSRGDRVRGRIVKPAHAGRHPVILLAGPDGCLSSVFVESAAAAWCARAALVVFDLPLCGSRKSDKLSALSLDLRLPLAQRLRAELEQQVASDIAQALALIEADPELDVARVTFVGVGLGAELARGYLAAPSAIAQVVLAPAGTPAASWLREVGERAARS
jgi:dienelactone hydrolase